MQFDIGMLIPIGTAIVTVISFVVGMKIALKNVQKTCDKIILDLSQAKHENDQNKKDIAENKTAIAVLNTKMDAQNGWLQEMRQQMKELYDRFVQGKI